MQADRQKNRESGKSVRRVPGSRAYVCHTFYHVYVACLKELQRQRVLHADDSLPQEQQTPYADVSVEQKLPADRSFAANSSAQHDKTAPGHTQAPATLILSKMSTDFGDLKTRARSSGIFSQVVEFDEKDYTYFPELVALKRDRGNIVSNMFQRIRFCRRMGELEASFVPVDFHQYEDIYVFCDSDPIGYYLSWAKIPYHAVEDGLNCLRYRDTAREDNRGAFRLKAWMARRGLIFIQNGYGRYCLDMEVNDLSVLDHPIPKMIECSREALVQALTPQDKEKLVSLFIENKKALMDTLASAAARKRPVILILSEPLCKDLKVREQLFRDMIREYGTIEENGVRKKGVIVIKPHPRDKLDYRQAFPDDLVLDAHFPMEILNFVGAQFDRVVTVYTVPSSIHCAKEKIYLGNAWMDRYEDPSAHGDVHNAQAQVTK